MRNWIKIACLVGFWGTQGLAQTTALTGLEAEYQALGWQAIGRLDADGAGFCTATLIDPETVLTAAHCVFDQRGAPVAPERLSFRAGLRNGSVVAERGIAQIEAHASYRPGRGFGLENVRHDVALLRLSQPIPTHEIDPFALHRGVVAPGPVSVVSYGRGRAELPSRQKMCQMVGQRDGVLAMNCDVTFGSSGAPVFSHQNGRGRIVSIISGMVTSNGAKVILGMELPDVVATLKSAMRANAARPVATIRRLGADSDKTGTGAKFVRSGGS